VASDKNIHKKIGRNMAASIRLALQGIWGRASTARQIRDLFASSKSTEVSLYSSDVEACLVELPPKCTAGRRRRSSYNYRDPRLLRDWTRVPVS
jgi:hypothetical protein